jgi:hypothetical protein
VLVEKTATEIEINATPDYVVMERGCRDHNPWSRLNRWFHRDVLSQAQQANGTTRRAERPIIQFRLDLELHNYGLQQIDIVDVRESGLTYAAMNGKRLAEPVFGQLEATPVDGLLILLTADRNPAYNNHVYRVGGIKSTGRVILTRVTEGTGAGGVPA